MPYISCDEAQCDYPEFCMSDHWVPGLREKFLREQAELWDERVDLLHVTFREHMGDVKFVIENWDTLDSMNGFGLASRADKNEVEELVARHVYRLPTTLIEALWWVDHFVSHEIHDDGSPAIAWVVKKGGPSGPWEWSSINDPKARGVLVSDPGSLMDPSARSFIGSAGPESGLADAVRREKEAQDRAANAWAAVGLKKSVVTRKQSEIQRDLKIILDDLFKKEFMP